MARRVDNAECRRVISALIEATGPDRWIWSEYDGSPSLGRLMRRAVLCIDWQRERAEKAEAALRVISEGLVSSAPEGHYLAHRHAVKVARAALKTEGA